MAAKPALSEVEGMPALQSQDAPASAKLLPRLLPSLIVSAFFFLNAAKAESWPQVQISHTTEELARGERGVARSGLGQRYAWDLSAHDGWRTHVDSGAGAGCGALDFRAVAAFSADEAFLMSAGPGSSRGFTTPATAGNTGSCNSPIAIPRASFDSMVFWDARHGVVLGDPVPDESGTLKFEVLMTDDGQNWRVIPPARLPAAMDGEGAFAASNTCLAIVSGGWGQSNDQNIWFATGGKTCAGFSLGRSRVHLGGFETPMVHGPDSAGIFSIAFRDAMHGVIAGGDYKRPKDDGPNLAFTDDGGKTWTLSNAASAGVFFGGGL
jgi:photosystem II stability/assembly factor-like uncharacterized protein